MISVGNLTVGGSGKTPLVAWLARYLQARGFKPCILSRGYGREKEEEILLLKGGEGPYDYKKSGDEPTLLAQKLPGVIVALGACRYAAAQAALDKFPIDLFLLDDAFQHQRLARDLNILLLDSTNPWGNGHLLPRGSLRETKESLSRADLIILTKAEKDKDYQTLVQELKGWNSAAPVLMSGYKSSALWQVQGSATLTPHELFDKNVLAFAGIAGPRSFFKTLNSLGAKIIKYITYPDHYPYNLRDISEIVKAAEAVEADFIVTTEKDAVRLEGMTLPFPFWTLAIEIDFLEDKKFLENLLNNLLVNKNEKRNHNSAPS